CVSAEVLLILVSRAPHCCACLVATPLSSTKTELNCIRVCVCVCVLVCVYVLCVCVPIHISCVCVSPETPEVFMRHIFPPFPSILSDFLFRLSLMLLPL